MRYEIHKTLFIGGTLRHRGDVIEYDGTLSPSQGTPLDQPAPEQKRETLHVNRRGKQTH